LEVERLGIQVLTLAEPRSLDFIL